MRTLVSLDSTRLLLLSNRQSGCSSYGLYENNVTSAELQLQRLCIH